MPLTTTTIRGETTTKTMRKVETQKGGDGAPAEDVFRCMRRVGLSHGPSHGPRSLNSLYIARLYKTSLALSYREYLCRTLVGARTDGRTDGRSLVRRCRLLVAGLPAIIRNSCSANSTSNCVARASRSAKDGNERGLTAYSINGGEKPTRTLLSCPLRVQALSVSCKWMSPALRYF